MDKEGLPPGSARRARAMKGVDAASLLGRMPERYSHVVRQWAEQDPSRLALRAGASRMTYGGLWDATKEAVRLLRKLGVGAGDRVVLVAENGLQIVPLLLAVSEMDAWAVPLNARMSVREVETIRVFAGCRRALYCVGDSEAAASHAQEDEIEQDVFLLGKVAVSIRNAESLPEPCLSRQDPSDGNSRLHVGYDRRTEGRDAEPSGADLYGRQHGGRPEDHQGGTRSTIRRPSATRSG